MSFRHGTAMSSQHGSIHDGAAEFCCSLHYSPEARRSIQTRSRENVESLASSKTCCCTLHHSPLPKPLFANDTTSVIFQDTSKPLPVIPSGETAEEGGKKDWRFWMIFVSVCVTTLLVAIDLSIVSTALPTIAQDLIANELYVWVANAYVLASTAVQPLFGQAANIFGRRSLTIASVLLFMLGSGLAGGATNIGMIIAARTIQGVGGGGIITLGEIIICDLLPLRERGQYTGLLAGTYAIGTIIGPVLGGIFTQHVTWRWIFYINLPIAGVALMFIVPFLNLKYRRVGTVWDRTKRVDWLGNFVLIGAVTSILLALAWGGTKYSWSSWNILLPMVIGFLGIGGFAIIQVSGYVDERTMPPRLFSNRTSVSIFVMAFVHGVLLLYVTYFLPVYFQAVKKASPTRAGVELFPTATTIAPAAAISGIIITITGRYRIFHYLGFMLMSIGCGLFALLDEDSSVAAWVGFQVLFGLGNGMVYNSMIPPLLASLPPSEVATATATWTFMRSFGSIWGIAIPSAMFNDRVNQLVKERLANAPAIAAQLVNGKAYERATASFIASLGADVRPIVVGIYVDALKIIWYASIAFAVIGLPVCFFVKSLDLTSTLETEFGMQEKKIEGRRSPA
ncbi:related to putative multidrug transporter Mfs1.1 (major facilitator family protein) [Rhynchosporium agropyri]|uniref:Related to putative multidrug transporter Mfs1.1 (Major facilitator family protein) n=1 Tax=Rhynchosporium agropyri TaxID=914238 RepID=A0A1E1L4V5_9HELO|nr:related to putative multidrug transporter Mfs1.1 (major facilitator family protein) [Rhynchosporium agropyri]